MQGLGQEPLEFSFLGQACQEIHVVPDRISKVLTLDGHHGGNPWSSPLFLPCSACMVVRLHTFNQLGRSGSTLLVHDYMQDRGPNTGSGAFYPKFSAASLMSCWLAKKPFAGLDPGATLGTKFLLEEWSLQVANHNRWDIHLMTSRPPKSMSLKVLVQVFQHGIRAGH